MVCLSFFFFCLAWALRIFDILTIIAYEQDNLKQNAKAVERTKIAAFTCNVFI